ncbi:hypothetical protein SDC9_52892 [bioreactor metagenome]|uniref:Secretion system C-terminal sorting domain-containing protein n=1 Tax=bioreactor metagenome TaxID=1076179 RepID=A0A644WRX3_9ZZZZ
MDYQEFPGLSCGKIRKNTDDLLRLASVILLKTKTQKMKTKLTFFLMMTFCLVVMTGHGQISPNILYPAQGTYSSQPYPFDGTDGYSYNASIYNKNSIGISGRIKALTFYVETACADSVTITIAYKHLTNSMFGGYDTWANTSAGSTQVYSGKVAFNTVGEKTINLQTPFNYDNSMHLGIYISAAWGGTGPSTPPAFRCKVIDSSTEYITEKWSQDNSFPTSQLCTLTDYLPAVGLKFVAPDQPIAGALLDSCNTISISTILWNPSEENILIAYNHTGTMTTPACGVSYTTGGTLSDGTEILYVGSQANIFHSGLLSGSNYYYKAWSFDSSNIYSQLPSECNASTNYTIPYSTTFDGGAGLPNLWTSDFENLPGHGETDQGITAELTPSVNYLYAQSPKFCGLTPQSKLQLDYRIVNISGYPSTATPAGDIDSVKILMKDPSTSLWTVVYSITPINHVASTNFTTLEIPVGYFSTGMTQVQIKAYSGTGSYFVDIDNFAVTDPAGIENNESAGLRIYPNPASDILNVVLSEASQIKVLDMTGRIIISTEFAGAGTYSIDLSDLSPGLYVIENTGATASASKFLKQ